MGKWAMPRRDDAIIQRQIDQIARSGVGCLRRTSEAFAHPKAAQLINNHLFSAIYSMISSGDQLHTCNLGLVSVHLCREREGSVGDCASPQQRDSQATLSLSCRLTASLTV